MSLKNVNYSDIEVLNFKKGDTQKVLKLLKDNNIEYSHHTTATESFCEIESKFRAELYKDTLKEGLEKLEKLIEEKLNNTDIIDGKVLEEVTEEALKEIIKKTDENNFEIIIKCDNDDYGYAFVWDGAGDEGNGDMRIQCYQSSFKKEVLLDEDFNESEELQCSKSYITEVKNKQEAIEEFFKFWIKTQQIAIIATSIEEAMELLKDSKVETAIIKN